jgi:hypothetical protein
MKPIPAEVVEQTSQRIGDLTVRQGEQLATHFSSEQPAVMAYLMAVDGDFLSEEERELLFYTGAVIWQIMAQGEEPLPTVTEEMIKVAEGANRKMLEPIAGLTDADAAVVVSTLVQHYGQPELLKYVIRTFMAAVRDDEVRHDNLGVMMIDLKTVIDFFNAS